MHTALRGINHSNVMAYESPFVIIMTQISWHIFGTCLVSYQRGSSAIPSYSHLRHDTRSALIECLISRTS